jgi:spermidine synthase
MGLLTAVGVLSAAALALEVLLVRMFSIGQWHHFAYMIISVALLGYGASGSFLAFARTRLLARFRSSFAAAAGLFGVAAPAAFALSQALPLNVLELAWDGRQQLYLLATYLVLAMPFFFAATAIGLALAACGERVGVVYRSDLIGAGLGALAVIGGLFWLPAERCLAMVGAAGLASAALAARGASTPPAAAWVLAVAAVVLPVVWPNAWASPRLSPYKELSLALTVPETRIVAERSSPLGLLTVVESPSVPFRYAPGLSLHSMSEPPEQLAVFTDGGGMTAITRFDGRPAPLAYLDQQTAALPYHLLPRPRVLVLGAGGGGDVLLARLHGAASVDAVDLNPQMVDLVRRRFADFAGDVYSLPEVRTHVAEARSFVTAASDRFDLIHIALLDSFSAAAAGLHALHESTLYTVEAFATYLARLRPGGIVGVTRWAHMPPRDGLKMFATAVEALRRQGVDDPGRRLALIHGWRTVTLVVKNGALSADEIAAVRRFCRERGFDIAYLPGMNAGEAGRFNLGERPYLYEGAAAILTPDRERFFAGYRFDVRPATDDRPYFFHFLKWPTLVELWRLRDHGGLNLVEWGYPVLLATLGQAAAASTVLILLPLLALRRGRRSDNAIAAPGRRLAVAVYFFVLGLAFLFLEMAFIQRLQLFLGHPLYAVSVGLCGFLVFAGIGSGSARWWSLRLAGSRRAMRAAVVGIALVAGLYVGVLPAGVEVLAVLPVALKIVAALLLIAPLAYCMGLPFPLGLAATAAGSPALVPWAWAINGCASVLSAVAATLLALHFGFSVVVFAAVGLYAVAATAFPAGLAGARPAACECTDPFG